MSSLIKSQITGIMFSPQKCVRIVNIYQNMFYVQNGVRPVDIYVSSDYKTGRPIFVFLYDKKDSYEVYKKWCAQQENKEKKDGTKNDVGASAD